RQVLGRDHQDVEDTLQEALIGALEALPRFRRDCSVGHFVRRVAFLTALNARRRSQLRGRLAPPALDVDVESLPTRAQSPADQAEAAARRASFCALLDELPD